MYCADIITFNTIALKGAIRGVGKAFDMPTSEVDKISNNVEYDEASLREEYAELFKYVDLLNGVIVSVGSHPAGVVVSPHSLEDRLGTCTLKNSKYPITQLDMGEVSSLNYVKLDLLGLDNVEIIDSTCKLAGIEPPTPDTIDTSDKKVWDSIRDSSVGIFQWTSSTAWEYYKKLFSDETIAEIRKGNKDFSYIDLFSMGNGAIRPAGESYRYDLARGIYKDNGHEVLNEFLKPTLGFIIFQEQIMEFLNRFCGFSLGESDIVRRSFSSKSGTEKYTPKITKGFIKTMDKDYGICKIEAEELIVDFIQVIEDASDYLFSVNHSQSYSYIGYVCAWLRYYHPLEFLTSLLNTSRNKQDKIQEAIKYILEETDIELHPIKFRYSTAEYMFDTETNSIYKGIESVKFMNTKVAGELYGLRGNKYNDFVDVLIDLKSKTSLNTRQIKILIVLDFFSEFGENKMLLDTVEVFDTLYAKRQFGIKKADELEYDATIFENNSRQTAKTYMDIDWYKIVGLLTKSIPNDRMKIHEQIEMEEELLGEVYFTLPDAPSDVNVVVETKLGKHTPLVTFHNVKTGKQESLWVDKGEFVARPLKKHDLVGFSDRTPRTLKNWRKI